MLMGNAVRLKPYPVMSQEWFLVPERPDIMLQSAVIP